MKFKIGTIMVAHVLAILLLGSVASAQLVTASNSSANAGLFEATQAFYNYPAWSGWYSGVDNNINYHDESLVAEQLGGCFPTGTQVSQAASSEWWTTLEGGNQLGNEWYLYVQNLSGSLAPGQSFTIKFRTCVGDGDQPFPQATVFYQKLNGKTLTGYLLTPNGAKLNFNQANSTGGNYSAMSGGVIRNQGMPGVWTFVISNPTKKPVQVYMGNFRMYLE